MFGGLTVAEAAGHQAPHAPAAAAATAAAPTAAAPAAPAAAGGVGKQSAPLDELFSGLTTSTPQATSSNSSLLSSLSQPQPLAQQQQPLAQRPAAADWLGADLGLTGAKMQQPAAPFVGLQVCHFCMRV